MVKIKGKYTTSKKCRLCGYKHIELFLDLGMMPLAGDYLQKKDIEKEKYYPLRMYWCKNCSYVGLMDIVAPEVFFTDYRYLSSVSLRDHFEKYAQEMTRKFSLQKNKKVLEIGSNDGVLLAPFKKLGVKAIGIDPARNIAKIANDNGLETIVDFFDEKSAKKIVEKYGQMDAIFANNVLAHMDDMDTMMKGIYSTLKEDGVLVFEVHYLIDLLKKLQYDFFYQEHFSYYTINSLQKFLKRHNMKIIDLKKIPIHSGSIRIYAKKGLGIKLSKRAKKMLDSEEELLTKTNIINGFSKRVQKQKVRLKKLLEKLKKEDKKIIGYGAAGRGNTLLNVCNIDSNLLTYIVDASPERYGRYTPGTHIPIFSPDVFHKDDPDYVLLLAWNYKKVIYDKEKRFIKNGGRFILPLPTIRIESSKNEKK